MLIACGSAGPISGSASAPTCAAPTTAPAATNAPTPSHFLYQTADDFNVTLDVAGPGILYFARYNHWHGSPWHYVVDGQDHIVRETSTADPLHPPARLRVRAARAVSRPLACDLGAHAGRRPELGAHPFREIASAWPIRARIYGTGYYIYHQFIDGAKLSQPDHGLGRQNAARSRCARADSTAAGTDIAPPAGRAGVREESGHRRRGRPCIAASRGPRGRGSGDAPRCWSSRCLADDRRSHSPDARLRITWDDRAQPSIDAPVALFFGAGILYNRDNREYLVKALPDERPL